MSNIYLGADGGYHDDTEENRDRFPAAEDTPAEEQAEGVPGETAPEPGTTPTDPDAGTLTPAGDAAGSGDTPVPSEPAPVEEQPAEPTARTAKSSTR
jgi:hypothetical protein